MKQYRYYGTVAGGKHASETNRERYGESFYRMIGRSGGLKSSPTKGFGMLAKSDPERHKHISSRGGTLSRRKK